MAEVEGLHLCSFDPPVALPWHPRSLGGYHHVCCYVQDDGRGPDADPGRSTEGHLGLRLLRDTLTDFGGDLEIQADDGGGMKLVATFPSTLVPT